jgi:hypothetical protein
MTPFRLHRVQGRSSQAIVILFAVAAMAQAQMPPVSDRARAALDAALAAKGVYVAEESAYRFLFPRADVSVTVDGQRLAAAQAPNSWATFAPSKNHEAIFSGEVILLADEVNSAISAALKAGLEVTGLGPSLLASQPPLFALNLNAEGTYQALGDGYRKVLDEVHRIRAERRSSSVPKSTGAPTRNAIDAPPLNTILSMRGVVVDGIYRAAIGRISLLNGTPLGREMGVSTNVAISGTNQQAVLDADVVANADELQRVLQAIRTRNLNINAIRNHFVGEHPQMYFVRVSGQGTAVDLARAIRYVLEVEVGVSRPGN